ncbi:M13 family metallopeptidase [Erythrobacter litoralis]|uniref:Probable zinc metalloproteinase n=1 Tax=Erythrobacter litoralis (strain HTCC2594) TaxID=314225 RepID=Q2N735_ERYLH|nr:M13 family metallopeptidase [Erythrobacter litoralis]ABC64506.1 probable zinc metalloproteinase [Erythrobacter litoralis HTCC2594]
MIRTVFATSASAFALALAAPATAQSGETDPNQADYLEEDRTPTMSFGSWGVDPDLLSDTVDPGDDFFAYVNQEWLDANPLPAEFSRFGAFNLLREKSTEDVKTLIDELVARPRESLSHDERRIVDTYNAFLDTDAIEARGLAPIQPYVSRIAAATTLDELAMIWAEAGYSSPIGGFVNVDAKQPDQYVAYIGIGGLGLPDRDYYLDDSEKGREIQQKYKDYMAMMLEAGGYDDPVATAEAVYALEEKMARDVIWERTARRNRDLTYHALSADELAALSGDVPVQAMLEKIGFAASPKFVVSAMPPSDERARALGLTEEQLAQIGSGLPGMMGLLNQTPVATLQAWTIKEFISDHNHLLPKKYDEAQFELYDKTLRGTPEQRPRWKRAIAATEGALGELVGASYVERYFPPENKAAMEELVVNLRKAMAQSIDEIEWMGEETKEQALAKLASFDPKIGYRDNLEVYEGLAVTPDDPIANSLAADAWQLEDNVAKLGQPIDRTEWFMTPQTVNAYYNPTKNEIVFPAAILQQPFFGLTADPAVNYGAIGGVIGHEIGHGFDDQGSKYDATGKLENWWTDQDRANFDERGDALVAQYDAFCPLDDGETCVNGRFTLGENIGDLGGLSLAYRAYKIATAGQDVPVIDGLSGDQRFFLAWAQVWRSAQREENYRQRLRTDSHSPEEYRVNGVVRNIDAWYDAFNVTEDDKLYLPPEERVRIW